MLKTLLHYIDMYCHAKKVKNRKFLLFAYVYAAELIIFPDVEEISVLDESVSGIILVLVDSSISEIRDPACLII